MIIRKLFKFEGAHIVRDCSSLRCKESIHGHSYVVEVFLTSDGLDHGQMIVDFGLLKTTIKDFIDSFDHTWSCWVKESVSFIEFVTSNSQRSVIIPISPSAEMFSLMFFYVIDKIIKNTVFNNGECNVELVSVRVHETDTGYAESFRSDLRLWHYSLEDIHFSNTIREEWRNKNMWSDLISGKQFINPIIELKFQ